jgi:hypothetical protein
MTSSMPAEQPQVAVVVLLGPVAGQIEALGGEAFPVRLPEPVEVAPDPAGHRRPGLGEHQDSAAAVGHRGAVVVDDVGADAGERRHGRAGLGRRDPGNGLIIMAPVSVCHQVSTTGQRSPPIANRYHIHASGLIGSPTEQRLADACYLWAFAILTRSPGARAYYDRRRTAGDKHNAALRRLGNKLLGQLHHCLTTGQHYNETLAWPPPTTT